MMTGSKDREQEEHMITENLQKVEERICSACARAGRDRSSVTLVAVSKTKPNEMIMEAYNAGIRQFGENRPQEMRDKCAALPTDISWHMIGRLQRNKVKYVVGHADLIHSVDSFKLAQAISEEAVKKGVTARVLVEVNMAGEESKGGVSPAEATDLVREIAGLPNMEVRGLMTIAPLTQDPEDNRRYFAGLRDLCIDIAQKNIDNTYMCELSMGMTGDYEVAIEEGATFVRVGTGIFGER